MGNTTNFSVRMDSELKKQCEALFGELGMNLTTAINIFLRQSLRFGGLPFEVKVDMPNEETLEAINEVRQMKKNPSIGKAYNDVDEMMKELLS